MANTRHMTFVAKLQKVKSKIHWLVTGTAHQIVLVRRFGKNVAKVVLTLQGNGKYEITPSKYEFNSTVSHWDYPIPEERWMRNKSCFMSLISTLKKAGIWEEIIDRNHFIKVNNKNKKSNKDKVSKQLSYLMS
jgi:hypothetical protein